MDPVENVERALLADVEAARSQFPQTQDLYREVCTVMFFRYGLTPTANKLYQLVRKGSMSAPAEALNRFWENLREKSRVTIEHPDLPDSLKVAAGALVATLWRSAQVEANEQVALVRNDARNRLLEAEERIEVAGRDLSCAQVELSASQGALSQARIELDRLRHEITSRASNYAALETQLENAKNEIRIGQARLDASRTDFSAELERIRQSAKQSEDRLAASETRALLEIDRERVIAIQARKALDVANIERNASEIRTQNELMGLTKQLSNQNEKNAVQEGQMRAMAAQQDALNAEIANLRGNLVGLNTQIAVIKSKMKRSLGAKTVAGRSQETSGSLTPKKLRKDSSGPC